MPDSCSVKTAGRNLVSLQGMPFDTRQESVLAAICCLRERSLRGEFLRYQWYALDTWIRTSDCVGFAGGKKTHTKPLGKRY